MRYVEATIFSFLPLTWQVHIACFTTSLKMLIFVSHTHTHTNKQTNKQTNPRIDKQSDYSTPCVQAHGVTNGIVRTVGVFDGLVVKALNSNVRGAGSTPTNCFLGRGVPRNFYLEQEKTLIQAACAVCPILSLMGKKNVYL